MKHPLDGTTERTRDLHALQGTGEQEGALRHVEGCLRSSGWPAGEKPSLIITIQGRHDRSYWLVVLARPDATLEDLDSLIRDVWVECCGHMSAFSIGKESYLSGEDEPGTSMAIPLSGLVPPGSTFSYEYDFGSTTELDLKVIGAIPIMPPEKPICLIARNNPPPFPCDACGNQAEFSLFDDEDGTLRFFCRECLVSAEPDPECTEIIENSPRTGICGYVEDPDAAVLVSAGMERGGSRIPGTRRDPEETPGVRSGRLHIYFRRPARGRRGAGHDGCRLCGYRPGD